ASVGSYIARARRMFDVRFRTYPTAWAAWSLAILSYLNFFADHYGVDGRWALFALAAVLFGRCWVQFTTDVKPRRMPLLVGFGLVALFIWFAESLATFASAWIYPTQHHGWAPVPPSKMGS